MAVREFLLGEDGYRAAVDAVAGIKTMQSLIFSVVNLVWQVNGGADLPESQAAIANLSNILFHRLFWQSHFHGLKRFEHIGSEINLFAVDDINH